MEHDSYISVQGRGTVRAVPDCTRLDISIFSVFGTYDEAFSQAKDNNNEIKDILLNNHLKEIRAKTLDFDIDEHIQSLYDEKGKYIESIKSGYKLQQKVRLDLPIDKELVNNVVKELGERIPGLEIDIYYKVQDTRPGQLKMLSKAVSDATEKAKAMAEAAGCSLGRVHSINYKLSDKLFSSKARNIHTNEEAKANTTEVMELLPEELMVSDTVEVTWRLK